MKRYLFTIEYKGARYSGWQVQKNSVTVQGVMQDAMSKLFKQKVLLISSGRTDAGVHALGQAAHADLKTKIPPAKMPFAINSFLPGDISVKGAVEMPPDFHARFSAKRKTYSYKMYYSPYKSPLKSDYYYHIPLRPDIDKMKEAGRVFIGEHDFKCFRATGSNVINTVRTIYNLEIDERDNEIVITVEGNGFLYNMVRIMAGTLLYAGYNKLTIDEIKRILISGDRRGAGKTLPPNGLTLIRVDY